MLIYFSQRSSYCRSASAKFAAAPFFMLPPAPPGRPPDWGWCQLACFLPPANPPTLRTLSEMVKKLWRSSLWSPGTFWIAPSSSPLKAFDRSAGWLPESGKILVKNSMNCFNQHIVGLIVFHDTLSTLILHFGGKISDGHCHGEISLIRCHGHSFSYFTFW